MPRGILSLHQAYSERNGSRTHFLRQDSAA